MGLFEEESFLFIISNVMKIVLLFSVCFFSCCNSRKCVLFSNVGVLRGRRRMKR